MEAEPEKTLPPAAAEVVDDGIEAVAPIGSPAPIEPFAPAKAASTVEYPIPAKHSTPGILQPSVLHNQAGALVTQLNNAMSDASSSLSPGLTNPRSFSSSIFGCLSPPSLSLITWCLPCVTFGKTAHRVSNDGDMAGYEAMNLPCLTWCVALYCGVHCIPGVLQSTEIRTKYNLKGNIVLDCLLGYFCPCCIIMQEEKETALLEAERRGIVAQPAMTEAMAYVPRA